MTITLDVIVILIPNSLDLYLMEHGVMAEEMTLRRYQTCRRQTQRATNQARKERLKSYADMII